MKAQTLQAAPVYTNFYGHSSLESPQTISTESDTVLPHSPRTVKNIGSVESLPTNKATNVRNDGRLTRHVRNRAVCHLDLDILDALTPTDLTDNILGPVNNSENHQLFSSLTEENLGSDSKLESPLLRKIQDSKAQTSDHETSNSKSHTSNKTASPYSNKACHKTNKDKSVELYKTEWCRNWQELGVCRYGKKCRYAHNASELRKIERHPRYKTQICRTYHEKGTCPYGVRCTFIHEQPSISNQNIYCTEINAGRTPTQTQTDDLQSKTTPSSAAKTETADDCRSTSLPWLAQPGTNLIGDHPNENKPMLPLSQMKKVADSRSASSTSSCWSPTLPNNIWGHPGFHSEVETTTEYIKRQKRSSSIASTSSLESSIFPADESSPVLDETVIYSQVVPSYISSMDDTWSEFSWLSLNPDMLKRHTATYLTVDL